MIFLDILDITFLSVPDTCGLRPTSQQEELAPKVLQRMGSDVLPLNYSSMAMGFCGFGGKWCFLVVFASQVFFPKQVYLWGSILEKNTLDTLVGALGLVGRGFGPAGRAGLGWAWGLAVLGALACAGWVGCGVGRAGRAGRVAGLGVVSPGWVRRGVWPAGRAGWVGRDVGRAGRAGWGVGRGVWPC